MKRAQTNNLKKEIPGELFSPKRDSLSSKQKFTFMESIGIILSNRKLLIRSLNIFVQWFAAFLGLYVIIIINHQDSPSPN